jgi:hypothetical protein
LGEVKLKTEQHSEVQQRERGNPSSSMTTCSPLVPLRGQ